MLPSTLHQRISVNFTAEFRNYFKNKQCELFHALFDVKLKNDKEEYINKVIPDITVICDKHGLNDKNYIGVPTLIIEILSPSNQSHNLITKMNLYQRFGVKEYWIVNANLLLASKHKREGIIMRFLHVCFLYTHFSPDI